MIFDIDSFFTLILAALMFGITMALVCAGLFLAHYLITLPMRRAESARLFLDVIETALKNGQPVEEAPISVSESRDLSMGPRFYLLAAWLEQTGSLVDALAKVPEFLPPQINAMLLAGDKIGDLKKVLPACRQLLKDALSQTRSAINYLVILTFVLTPSGMFVLGLLKVSIFPKFLEIGTTVGGNTTPVAFLAHQPLVLAQFFVLLLLWLAAFIYIAGPRAVEWFPVLERLHYRLPWRRKRMQRDFSSMLAILLDSGVPEPEAVTLAANCSANRIFRRRAARVVGQLQQGQPLTQAVQAMDDSGEFAWRLTNAVHGGGGFFQALAGWHESLDAKAFQQEQAAAHGATTGLVLWSGLFVGAIAIAVFGFLVSLVNEGALW